MGNFFIILKIFNSLLILNLLTNVQARSLEFRSSIYKWSPTYFSSFNITLQNKTVSGEFDLIRPLIKDFKANIEFQIRLANSKKYQTLFGYNFDVCAMVISFKDTVFKRLFKSILKNSNFMQNCPIHEGHYYFRDWRMDSDLIPSYLYAGDYRFKGRGYMSKTLKNRTKIEEFILLVTTDAVIADK